jgi:YHS domain-containing protein
MKTILFYSVLIFAIGHIESYSQVVEPIDKNKVANGGYDLVSYFVDNKAVKGSAAYTYVLNGTKYYFASANHLQLFKSDSQKYLPVCDGYCSWAVAEKSKKVPVNPLTFKIIKGKLHLFFNGDTGFGEFNALEDWNKNEEQLYKILPQNWAKIK